MKHPRFTLAAAALLARLSPASGQGTLRIAMTASDIPTATGMPNNGFEGMRFMGYPIFEGLVLWDLSRADKLAGLRPGLAEKWEQAEDDKKTWIFHLRRGVKFHDGTDFTADAVIWNLDRYFKNDSPQFEPPASGISRARVPLMDSYKKIDDYTVSITTKTPASYFPYMAVYLLITSPNSFEKAGRDWSKVATLPAAGTGPFRITKVTPREGVDLVRNDGYWDAGAQGEARRHPPHSAARGDLAHGGAALGPGRLDRGAAAGRHPVAQAGGLRDHHQFLSARLAVAPQHERHQQPAEGRARAAGPELLRRPRRARSACSTTPPSRRSAG